MGTALHNARFLIGFLNTVYKLGSTSLTLPPLALPLCVCVHVRTQQAGSSPRAQMLSVNTTFPERKQGFTAASCKHSQDLQRPGAMRGQPAPHKHRPPCLLSEPLVLLPGSGWAWFIVSYGSSEVLGAGNEPHSPYCRPGPPLCLPPSRGK